MIKIETGKKREKEGKNNEGEFMNDSDNLRDRIWTQDKSGVLYTKLVSRFEVLF